MAIVHDFVEGWIEMRSKLQRQLKLREADRTWADCGSELGEGFSPTAPFGGHLVCG